MNSTVNPVLRLAFALVTIMSLSNLNTFAQTEKPTVRIALAGLEHDHAQVLRTFLASYFWPNWDRKDFDGLTALAS